MFAPPANGSIQSNAPDFEGTIFCVQNHPVPCYVFQLAKSSHGYAIAQCSQIDLSKYHGLRNTKVRGYIQGGTHLVIQNVFHPQVPPQYGQPSNVPCQALTHQFSEELRQAKLGRPKKIFGK